MSDSKAAKDALMSEKIYSNISQLEFLTNEHIKMMRVEATEVISGMEPEDHKGRPESAVTGEHIWQGNHFYKTIEGGVPYWYWESTPGSQCGRTKKWRYKVNAGDTVGEAASCPQGYPWFEMKLHYI
jgi:hypothetical protein